MNYFKMSIKRISKAISTLLFITLIILIAGAVLLFVYLSRDKEITAIGVVGNTEDTYIDFALTLLEENESFDILPLSKEEADTLLKSQKIQGYAEIPAGFVDAAMSGENIPFSYTVLKKPSSLYHVITKETVSMVSVLLNESQNAVYGMRRLLRDNSQKALLREKSEEMSFKYVANILQRKNLFDVTTTGVANKVSTVEYYFVSIIIIFALVLGVSLSSFMIKSHMGLPLLLKSRGISPLKQVICELFSFFLAIYSIIFILLVALCFIAKENLIFYAIKLIPVIFSISALQFFIYELSDSLIGGTLFQFFSSLVLAFISGCFYPSFLFPEKIRLIADILPIVSAFSLGRTLLSSSTGLTDMFKVLLWSVAFLIFSALVRKARIERAGL